MFRLKGCVKCSGDLFQSDGDWQCLQCGKYYYMTAPWSYDHRREGVWGSAGKVLERRVTSERNRPKNKSVDEVASV